VLKVARMAGDTQTGQTRVRCLVITANAAQGTATLEHAALDSTRLAMTASGTINLANETLAVQLRPTARVGGQSVVVPLRLSGSFRAPSVASDTNALPQAAAQAATQGALSAASRLLGGKRAAAATLNAQAPAAREGGGGGGEACGLGLAALRAQNAVAAPAAR
jgi:AsmA protein